MSDDQLSARRRSPRRLRASATARPGRHLELVTDTAKRDTANGELAELVVLRPQASPEADVTPSTRVRTPDGGRTPASARRVPSYRGDGLTGSA